MSNDVPTTENETPTHFDVLTDEKLAAKMIGFRQGQGCTIVMLYAQPQADVRLVKSLDDQIGPQGEKLPLPIAKTWVLVSTAKKS